MQRRHIAGHLVEQSLDGVRQGAARDRHHQVAQEFPFGPRVARRVDRREKALHAPVHVREAPPLLDRGASRQEVMSQGGGRIRQDIRHDQSLELGQQVGAQTAPGDVLAEHQQRPQTARPDSLGEPGHIGPHRIGSQTEQARPGAVGIAIGRDEPAIRFPRARHGVRDGAEPLGQLAEQIEFFVCLAGRGDDRHGAGRCVA